MRQMLITVAILCMIPQLMSGEAPERVSSDDLVGTPPKKVIVGPLGAVLGGYITIEGKPCSTDATGKFHFLPEGDVTTKVHMLQVLKVDGVKLKAPVIIPLSRTMQSKPTSYYVIRGFQTGKFGSRNIDPKFPNMGDVPKVSFQFVVEFVPTKDLTDYSVKKTNK